MYLLLAYCNYTCVDSDVERYITWIGKNFCIILSIIFSLYLGYANSFCNPVIYAFSNKYVIDISYIIMIRTHPCFYKNFVNY